MRSSENFAHEIREGEFTKRECTILLGKPDGQGGVKPVHGSTVQRFCRDKPEKITRLFHPGQSIPYAFRIVSDELIAKIITNRTYEFILSERQSHQFKSRGGVFEAEIIDSEPPPQQQHYGTHQSSTHPEMSTPESEGEGAATAKPQGDLREDVTSSLINVDGIRTQYIEKMEKLEDRVGELSRENGELSEAKKYLQQGLESKEAELLTIKEQSSTSLNELSATVKDREDELSTERTKLQGEKTKNLVSTILFIASFSVIAVFFWYKLSNLNTKLTHQKDSLEQRTSDIKTAQQHLSEERSAHKQAVDDLRASVNSWRLNSESRAKDIERLDAMLEAEKKSAAELKKELDMMRSQFEPEPSLQGNRR